MPTPKIPTPKIRPDDQNEINRLKKRLSARNAYQFNQETRFRPQFRMWVIEMMDPSGETPINEFNFHDEAAANQALEEIKRLIHKT